MSIQRRCPSCGAWNGDEDNCTHCGQVLNPKLIRDKQDAAREERRKKERPSQLDEFVESWKNSRWLLLRGLYWVAYSVWFVIFSIVSFFLVLIAGTPG